MRGLPDPRNGLPFPPHEKDGLNELGSRGRTSLAKLRRWCALSCLAAALFGVVPFGLAEDTGPSPRETEARKAFAMGAYREALELFAALYADDLHPNYLHNIGRCYQNLGEWDRALASFQDYLRKSPDLSVEARHSVEGYIAELKAQLQKEAQEREAQRLAQEHTRAQATAAQEQVNPRPPSQKLDQLPGPSSRRARVSAWSLVAAGGVSIGVGTYFGVRSLRAYADAEDGCPSRRDCSRSALAAREDAERSAWASNFTLIGGLAAGVAGVVWVWRRRSIDAASARVKVSLAPRGTGLELTVGF